MDERQAQIKEGAGLEDSRINTEFLDFLSKWSTPFFVLLLIVAAAMFGYRKLEERRVAAMDRAFQDLALATQGGNPSPTSLANLYEEYSGARAVGLLAKLQEADIYLNAVRAGLEPGASIDPATGQPEEGSLLDEERTANYLSEALRAYRTVLDRATEGDKPMLAIPAAFGVASCLASQGDLEGARSAYRSAADMAERDGYALLAQVATDRIAGLDSLPDVTLYRQDELPALPTLDPALDAITDSFPTIQDDGLGVTTTPDAPEQAGADTGAESDAETGADAGTDTTQDAPPADESGADEPSATGDDQP
ncbi:MAG: hypothetical protein ACF8Q5_02850 [Phycisphaerales bacterium JB040]